MIFLSVASYQFLADHCLLNSSCDAASVCFAFCFWKNISGITYFHYLRAYVSIMANCRPLVLSDCQGICTTITTTTTIQRPFVRDNPGRPVPEETFTRSHLSWSTYFLYHLSPFATVHGILFIQLTCLTVLSNNFFPGPLWSSPWS